MKLSVAEKPQWEQAVPNQAVAAEAGVFVVLLGWGTGRGYSCCKERWLGWEAVRQA